MQGKAVMMYRIVNGFIAIPKLVHLTRRETSTCGHYIRFHQPQTLVFPSGNLHIMEFTAT